MGLIVSEPYKYIFKLTVIQYLKPIDNFTVLFK